MHGYKREYKVTTILPNLHIYSCETSGLTEPNFNHNLEPSLHRLITLNVLPHEIVNALTDFRIPLADITDNCMLFSDWLASVKILITIGFVLMLLSTVTSFVNAWIGATTWRHCRRRNLAICGPAVHIGCCLIAGMVQLFLRRSREFFMRLLVLNRTIVLFKQSYLMRCYLLKLEPFWSD
jgi:hypothetical protein